MTYMYTGQECTHSFPSGLSRYVGQSYSVDVELTRIIPGMKITCAGSLIKWTVAGRARTGSIYPKLKVFREDGGIYNFIGEIVIGQCTGQPVVRGQNGLYECELQQENRLLVQPNDFIAIYVPTNNEAAFDIYFTSSTTNHRNYIYSEDLVSNVSLSGTTSLNTPQINIEIGSEFSIEIFPNESPKLITTSINFTPSVTAIRDTETERTLTSTILVSLSELINITVATTTCLSPSITAASALNSESVIVAAKSSSIINNINTISISSMEASFNMLHTTGHGEMTTLRLSCKLTLKLIF